MFKIYNIYCNVKYLMSDYIGICSSQSTKRVFTNIQKFFMFPKYMNFVANTKCTLQKQHLLRHYLYFFSYNPEKSNFTKKMTKNKKKKYSKYETKNVWNFLKEKNTFLRHWLFPNLNETLLSRLLIHWLFFFHFLGGCIR